MLGANASRVSKLIIFKSSSADLTVPAACLSTGGSGVSGVCNIVRNPFDGSPVTMPTDWPVATRNRNNSSADYLGVYVEYSYPSLLPISGGSKLLKAQASFRLEPPVTQSANLQPLPTFAQAPPDAPGWTWTEPDWGGGGDSGPYVPPDPGNGAG